MKEPIEHEEKYYSLRLELEGDKLIISLTSDEALFGKNRYKSRFTFAQLPSELQDHCKSLKQVF